jgi:hypothetical protein
MRLQATTLRFQVTDHNRIVHNSYFIAHGLSEKDNLYREKNSSPAVNKNCLDEKGRARHFNQGYVS